MKHLTALFVALALLLCGTGFAAEWAEGLGPGKPYTDSTAINLETTFGYIIMYPRGSKPANGFCNKLLMYFPREDVFPGEGTLTVYEAIEGEQPVEFCTVDMGDARNVSIRPMTEDEKTAVIWGSGVCAEIHIPRSLEYADGPHSYFVFMDEGCLTAGKDGMLKSPRISSEKAWLPTIEGDYGISGFRYVDAEPPATEEEALEALFAELEAAQNEIDAENATPAPGETPEAEEETEAETETESPEATPAPEEEEIPSLEVPEQDEDLAALEAEPPVAWPDTGDKAIFDLVMGGEAYAAVPFSPNGSVDFDQQEYNASTHIIGTVTKDEVDWGIVFLREDGTILQTLMLGLGKQ